MNKIIIHWTAGTNQPNSTDYRHYHFLVTSDGLVVEGKFPVLANEKCRADAKGNALYAAHCGGGNTGAIGIALCGMANFRNSKNIGRYPLTKVQCERTFKLIVELCIKYGIIISDKTVMTHYEFGLKNPKTTSRGKIDIIYLPPYSYLKANEIGNFFRNKAKWYLNKINK